MSIVAGLFLLLALLCITVPVNVPPGWRLSLVFTIVWFIIFVCEKAGVVKLP